MDRKADTKNKDPTGEKKDWAEMSDEDGENDTAGAAEDSKAKPEPEVKKYIPPTQKGTKNKQGDYIVEKFEITDFRDEMKANKDEESEEDDSSDDNFYGDEDDNQNQKAESPEAKKEEKPQEKKKSKKELKAEEDAELEALLGGMTLDSKKATGDKQSKETAKPAAAGENSSKNQKKKEK